MGGISITHPIEPVAVMGRDNESLSLADRTSTKLAWWVRTLLSLTIMLRALAISVVWIVCSLLARTAHARSPRNVLRAACPQGALTVAGPFVANGAQYWTAVSWTEGSARACLAVLRDRTIIARKEVAAEWSERYREFIGAPGAEDVIAFPNGEVALVTVHQPMNVSGGSIEELHYWFLRERQLRFAGVATRRIYSTINDASDSEDEKPDACVGSVTIDRSSAVPAVIEAPCHDGHSVRPSRVVLRVR